MNLTLEGILADPPQVHPSAPTGVWATEAACYRYIAETLTDGMRTLETGLGVSTAVFLLCCTEHTSVFLEADEGDRLLAYLARKGFESERLTLRPGPSDAVLPTLVGDGELDFVLLDGCHAYPFPQLDWFYAASRLRKGGVAVVDDLQFPAPFQLMNFLDADPRWQLQERTEKWAGFRRLSGGSLREEWRAQPFFGTFKYDVRQLARRVRRKTRHSATDLLSTRSRDQM